MDVYKCLIFSVILMTLYSCILSTLQFKMYPSVSLHIITQNGFINFEMQELCMHLLFVVPALYQCIYNPSVHEQIRLGVVTHAHSALPWSFSSVIESAGVLSVVNMYTHACVTLMYRCVHCVHVFVHGCVHLCVCMHVHVACMHVYVCVRMNV